jgi:hypothetical protein
MAKSRIVRVNPPRKQHVISRFYLEAFASEEGSLFVYEVGKPVRRSVPLREATEKDFFEYEIPGDKSAYRIEGMLGKLEALAGPVRAKLARGESSLTKDERLAWAFFVASTFLRSRRVRNELSTKIPRSISADWLGSEHVRETQYEIFMKYGRLIPADEIARAAHNALDEHSIPALRHTHAIRGSTRNLAFVLAQKHWQVVEACEECFFVTCDAPVVSFQLRGNELYDGYGWRLPNVHVALPLSPQVIFLASPPDIGWVQRLDAHNTELLNLVTTRFADRYVYADRQSADLAATLSERGRTMVFGDNAFKLSNS